ncbi:putative phosphatase regulatory subunit [Favolaschia claudopus]|uniref:Phosphatase regulatory subunit n=1 Tax=Favolaschia claudopus TaxID=2862362 RepID=A0AAV9ZHL6_9AGAR
MDAPSGSYPFLGPAGAKQVKLQKLSLHPDGAKVHGTIEVQSAASEAWLAVRYTFDGWQTTKEVRCSRLQTTAVFSIPLHDLFPHIHGKSLILAVRCVESGNEIWDNNNGSNYRATFSSYP